MGANIDNNLVCVGVIVAAKGIQGQVKIKPFTENLTDIDGFDVLYNEDQTVKFKLKKISVQNNIIVASLEGVDDRNKAEELKGTKLYITRSQLPKLKEEEFYYTDLIGMSVLSRNGEKIGEVFGVENFGAGDVVEVSLNGSDERISYPFTKEFFPEINLEEKYITLNFSEEI